MSDFKQNLGFFQGLALYLAAVLGTGILIIPILAWNEGGPASLIAWVALGGLGLTLAWTFASVGAEQPDAGGVQAMIGRVFGFKIKAISRYLIFFTIPAGAVAAAHILAYHLCAAFALSAEYVPLFGYGGWILVTLANYFGIQVSANAQLILSSLLILILGFFVVLAFPNIKHENFTPFMPHGLMGIGHGAIIIFWSFLGWEAIAHLAEEFKNPKRDMLRAAVVAAIVVGILYFAVSFVLIGLGLTGGHLKVVADMAPLVKFADVHFGELGRIFMGIMAAVVCLGTMNAYTAGLSRLSYSMAQDGDLPAFIGKIENDGTPRNGVLLQFFINCLALTIQQVFKIDLKFFFLIPNLAFLVLYFLGCLAAARLLKGHKIAVLSANISAGACAVMIPFASGAWVVPTIVGTLAFIKLQFFGKKRPV